MVDEFELFEDGSVTFLPALGDTLHRWNHLDLSLPEFPRPYSEKGTGYSTFDVHLEVSGGPDHSGHLNHSLTEIVLPDPACLPFSSIGHFRDEVPTMTNVLIAKNVPRLGGEKAREDSLAAARDWTRQYEAAFARTGSGGGHMSAVVGSGGPKGSAMTAAGFLLRGGSIDELARMITHDGPVRLEVRTDSMLAALTKAWKIARGASSACCPTSSPPMIATPLRSTRNESSTDRENLV